VEQASFVPLNAVMTLFVNAITGIIIWEDWRVVGDWTGYVCVFLLFILGSGLLLGDLPLLSESDPEAFRAGFSAARKDGLRKLFSRIQSYRPQNEQHEANQSEESDQSFSTIASGRPALERVHSKREAWLSVFHVNTSDRSLQSDASHMSFRSHGPPRSHQSIVPPTILEENSDEAAGRSSTLLHAEALAGTSTQDQQE
jgi:hypothetical protein